MKMLWFATVQYESRGIFEDTVVPFALGLSAGVDGDAGRDIIVGVDFDIGEFAIQLGVEGLCDGEHFGGIVGVVGNHFVYPGIFLVV